MTTLPKVQRIARAVERAEAHKAITDRAAALAARPFQARPSPAIPAHLHRVIAATVSAPAPAIVAPPAPVSQATTTKAPHPSLAGHDLPSPSLSEAEYKAALPQAVATDRVLRVHALTWFYENN